MVLTFKCDCCGTVVQGESYGHEEEGDICLVCNLDSELLYLHRTIPEKKELIQKLELEVLSLVEKVKDVKSKRDIAKESQLRRSQE